MECLFFTKSATLHALGSADGYNTESPERLHIDFAKEAYRASNKRDYMEQMALWLQRHEAMWLRESYLIWIEDRLSVVAAEKNEENDEAAAEDDNGDNEENVIDDQHQHRLNVSTNKDFKRNLNYSLATRPPYQKTTVDKIVLKYGAIDFISTLSTFLRKNFTGTTIIPSIHDRFDVYRQLVIKLPHNPYVSDSEHTDRL